MQAYYSLFTARFALLLQYRAAALAGVVTQMFWGFLKIMVLQAFFTNTTFPQPMTFSQAVGYVWLGQGFLFAIVPWGGDRETQETIRSGAIGYDLLRPIDLYNFWFVRVRQGKRIFDSWMVLLHFTNGRYSLFNNCDRTLETWGTILLFYW
jgi:ABC-2 type transport system permease protein